MYWIYGAFYISIVVALLFKSRIVFVNHNNRVIGHNEKRNNVVLMAMYAIPLMFVAACRYEFIDTSDYRNMYQIIGPSINNALKGAVQRVEKGYLLFTALLNYISTDSQFLFIISSIIIIGCFCHFISCEATRENITFCLISFSTSLWISTMNGLRQILVAAVICLLWMKWSKMQYSLRNSIPFIIAIVILSSIHLSILICIPIFAITRGKLFNKAIGIAFLITTLMLAFSPLYEWFFLSLLRNTSYSSMINTETKMGIPRLILRSIPMVFIILYKVTGRDRTEKNYRLVWMLNMSVLSFLFSILSLRMVYFSRVRIYFNIFSIVSLPLLIDRCFNKNTAKVIKVLLCIFYILLFHYQNNAYGQEITEFKLFFEA